MNQTFTFKTLLITLLVMICCAVKAETVSYADNDFTFKIDLETQEAILTDYHGNAENVVIPENVIYEGKEYKVTSLGNQCFFGCSSLVSVSIPSSVTSLGDGCFEWCSRPVSIEIPSSVTSLGTGCFHGCCSLTSVNIPSSVTSIGERCFSDCSALVSIEIPSSVTSLGNNCFDWCTSLASIEIPSSVTSLGDFCFSSCSSLASVNIPSSVTSLGEHSFSYCVSLISIEIPSSVTSIGDECFFFCSSLETIVVDTNNPCYDSREGCNAIIETASNTMVAGCKSTFIPSSVTSLGDGCFSGCSSLASIEIPSSVTSIGRWCFSGCSSLETIVVDANNPCYDSREGCNAIIETAFNTMITGCKNTFIPSSVTSLSESCFDGCSSLVSIDIPSSVTRLGVCCFGDCSSLVSIDIPSSVTSLGEYCFGGCSSLETVICRMESVKSGNFFGYGYGYGTPIENATLYVPESLLATYQATDPWSRFGTILPLTEEVELGVGDISKSAVSLRSDDGSVVLSGLADGTPVSYYSVDGRLLGRTSVNNGSASFSVKPNSIVTVKAGKQSFKVHVK